MKGKKERLAYTEQAKKIVDCLSLDEKISLMSGNLDFQNFKEPRQRAAFLTEILTKENSHYNMDPYEAGGIEREGVPPMKFVDGPRGVVCGIREATCFPVSMARGASFDADLEEKIGHAIGKEVRAFGGNLFAGVCINVPYNPGWGRSQETYGEDTYHIGQMGAALTRGVQEEDIMACVKHFAFNQMENARFKVSVTCDQRTEKEVFLPQFKDCIDAGAASVMSSYNRYNGVHCGHNAYLLNQVLKKEWDFDGFIMSDFIWGVKDTVEAANGGQNMEMFQTEYFGDALKKAVEDGFVKEEVIDDAAVRIVRTIIAFDDEHKEYGKEVVGCKEHIALAKQAAEESITLIKNENVLPLDKSIKKIALIGNLATKENIGDRGSSWVRAAYVVTPEEGIRKAVPEAEVIIEDGSDIEKAKKAASEADAVIFVVGYNHDDEGEFISENDMENYTGGIGGDRKNGLGLHKPDVELIKEVGPVNPKSAVVLIGGNMIMMNEWIDCVNAVMMAYYPGQEGGTAIAEILFGDVNPSGKLPFVVPYDEADLPQVDWEAEDQYYEYYHGYKRLEKYGKTAMYPYGYGISYTKYEYGKCEAVVEGDQIRARISVKNTGDVAGTEVVQMYAGFKNSGIDRPVKQLCGFKRVELMPGEEKECEIICPLKKLEYYDPVVREWKLESMDYEIMMGPNSSNEELLGCVIAI